MTDLRTQFHVAPPGWVAVYGDHGREVAVAGFFLQLEPTAPDDGDDRSGIVGQVVVCDPKTGALVGSAEWGARQNLPLTDVRQQVPPREDREYDRWGERWPAYDVDRVIQVMESLAEKIGGVADAVLRAAD